MSEFLFSYGLFIAKVVTSLVALLFAVAIIAGARKKDEGPSLKITNLNDRYSELKTTVLHALMDKKQFKQYSKAQAKAEKKDKRSSDSAEEKARLFVLEFEGDIRASEVETLREEITAVLSIAEPRDEVLLRLDNSGGMVHEHGLAASQLQRIKDAELNFTVSVDKVAASGGYMMACIADRIVSAPFAILGSIGVLAQLPNFNRLLDKAGIDFEQHTAGEYKRTVTMFGKNGEKEREKLQTELQETHVLFRDFVKEHRPVLDIDKVSTGEHWYGKQALELNLVDELITSDDYLVNALKQFNIFEVKMELRKGIPEKLMGGLFSSINQARARIADVQNISKYH
ncbi:protease SohB [Arenicella xantha]|uniref:Inner membrane peptidase n=1 Tax=Arenicella xantha TaxID=644221 RepID=A0A395JPN2_9GAMM|nr:protease SohB [Arenicella xantha]RBP53303.1 inner membrane peptidase [Arenicella xantha]